MIIGRLHAIPNWDIVSTSSAESDDLPSLTDAEWKNLEDRQYKLNPLWPENVSDSLPPELQPFLLSRPVGTQHLQDNKAKLARDDEKDHSISEESSLFWDDEMDHTNEESSLFGDSDETDHSINETSTPASLPRDRISLPNVGFQPPVGQHYAWTPSHVGLQHPGVQHVARMPSSVNFQPLPGPHYYWMPPSQGANGMIMMPPSNLTCPYAMNTAFPPSTQFYPPANASTAPPPSTSSFRHRTYIPRTGKWTQR
ncbi:hypothetical protein DFJ58DRAFT_735532 [Suillus subalutaceus]|uniref:uncharacterized protein n=1 Tax=Suillus subalutaceus TaxID=48586 RepID=UPI001B85C722|nr:uncharacterized protein DFJ58DRAFT_735532 [Suillus subalutaceus]KAG1835422.1 hypothetical protein DFJ58DRAFT_735532 [Suillus subalutaceus]